MAPPKRKAAVAKRPGRSASAKSPAPKKRARASVTNGRSASVSRKDDEKEYEIEAVTGVERDLSDGSIMVAVKWLGWPWKENSWEELAAVNAKELLEPYRNAINKLKTVPSTRVKASKDSVKKNEYEVENILGIQWNNQAKRVEYKIQWLGWADKHNEWEPETNVVSCDSLLTPFRAAADTLRANFAPATTPAKGRGRAKKKVPTKSKKTPAKGRGRPAKASNIVEEPEPAASEDETPTPKEEIADSGDENSPAANNVDEEEQGEGDAGPPKAKKGRPAGRKVGPKSRTRK